MKVKKLRARVARSAPMQIVRSRSQKTFIPGFSGFSLYETWKAFLQQLKKANLPERSAAISFNIVMAIPPTLIFLFTLIPHMPISDKFIQELYTVIRDVVPGKQNNEVIISFLDDFLKQPRNELLSFGLLLAMIFSSNAMMGILRSFDEDYEGFEKRNTIQNRQTALFLTLFCFIFFFVFLLLLIAQGVVLQWLGIENELLRGLIVNFRWVIIVLLVFYTISFIYHHGPALAKRWPLFTPGSVFATVLMVLATYLFSIWVENFSNYNKVYGSIGTIFILMSLIFVNSLVVLMGFELNVALSNLKRKQELSQIKETVAE